MERELRAVMETSLDFQKRVFAYTRCRDHDAAAPASHPVVVVGTGPVGLTLAIDLAQRGIPVVLLDNDDRLSTGSRAICFAKRTLEIFDRLGCGDAMAGKGVSWQVGRVFFGNAALYQFDLLPEADHHRPAFVNLQQYYVEGFLCERAAELPLIDLRWKSQVVGIQKRDDSGDHGAVVEVETPDGRYRIAARFVVACDGSRSSVRRLMGLESQGRRFKDRFLIADVKMKAGFPPERWFWFDPPFHRNQSVLLHRQPDDIWRIDFQLGWDADPEAEKRPERIVPRVEALLDEAVRSGVIEGAIDGNARPVFELEWASVYTFSCLRMESFRHGAVLFAGDAAHGVSPFGARGANSGVQDADNLGWKLAAVLQGKGGDALLDSYAREREYAADENIRHSTRATDFITPKSEVSRLFRDAVLDLAKDHAFARTLVNSGRLSTATTLTNSALNTPDVDAFRGAMTPGAAAADAPIDERGDPGWLLDRLQGGAFTALLFTAADDPAPAALLEALRQAAGGLAMLDVLQVAPAGSRPPNDEAGVVVDRAGRIADRYDAKPGTLYLLRPDQHIAARWRDTNADSLRAALRRALALC